MRTLNPPSPGTLILNWKRYQIGLGILFFLSAYSYHAQAIGLSFSDVTHAANLDISHNSPNAATITGGLAVADIDGDGDVDLYIITGDQTPNALMQNNGDGTFTDITQTAGVGLAGEINAGPLFADLNGDGQPDLVVGGYAGSGLHLFLNTGNNVFVEALNTGINNDYKRNDFSASAGDPDQDGDLDLFITHWGPRSGANHLWINDGDAHFSPGDISWQILSYQLKDFSFTANFSDINNDGLTDLLVTGDFATSEIFINQGNGRFINTTSPTIDDENGMGAAVADFDNDGDLDWFVSSIFQTPPFMGGNIGQTGSRYYQNNGDGSFTNATDTAGLREGFWGWGACAADFNNDGWLDLVHTNGFRGGNRGNNFFVDPMRLFINQQDGTFIEQSASLGVTDTQLGRGISCLDYDNDGDIDILVMNNNGTLKLYRNDLSGPEHYLQVLLQSNDPSATVIGSRITLEVNGAMQMREINSGSNFESQNPQTQHFGLGAANRVDKLTINWPDGSSIQFENVMANRKITLSQSFLSSSGLAIPISKFSLVLIALLILLTFRLALKPIIND